MSNMPKNEPPSGWSQYRREVDSRWSSDYYTWVRANIRAEVWTVTAGIISPAAAALFAYYIWPRNLPISPGEAIGGAAILGLIGGLVVFLVLFLFNSTKARLLAPYRLWAASQEAIAGLTKAREQLKSEVDEQARRLGERDSEIVHLKTANAELAKTNNLLQTQLDAKRQLALVPKMGEEDDPVAVLPITFGDLDGQEEELADRILVSATFSHILIINNSDYPTTILRLWLRVREPSTNAEIVPLRRVDLGPPGSFMPPVEEFTPADGAIEARGKRVFELKFTSYYSGDFGRRIQSSEKRARAITLCAEASGLETKCCTLSEEFF